MTPVTGRRGTLGVTWWGHATTTVELGGTRVLTDPLLVDRLAHLRRTAPGVGAEACRADVVLVSHLHPDHLHVPSLRLLDRRAVLVVPRGSARLLSPLGIAPERLREVVPGDRVRVAGVEVEVLTAHHDARRHVLSRLSAPPLGFRVEGAGASFWFPGDTGLSDELHAVRAVDLALVPVGGWGPTLPPTHLGPREAAVAVRRVGAAHAVPVHYGTFWPAGMSRLGRHQPLFVEPGDRFAEHLAVEEDRTLAWLPAHGERFEIVTTGTTGRVDG